MSNQIGSKFLVLGHVDEVAARVLGGEKDMGCRKDVDWRRLEPEGSAGRLDSCPNEEGTQL